MGNSSPLAALFGSTGRVIKSKETHINCEEVVTVEMCVLECKKGIHLKIMNGVYIPLIRAIIQSAETGEYVHFQRAMSNINSLRVTGNRTTKIMIDRFCGNGASLSEYGREVILATSVKSSMRDFFIDLINKFYKENTFYSFKDEAYIVIK